MAAQQNTVSSTSVPAGNNGTGAVAPQGGGPQMLVMMAIIFAIFYFIIILPTKKKQKKHTERIGGLKGGERVITAGGIYGKVLRVMDDRLELEVDKGSKLLIAKASISTIIPAEGKEKVADKKNK